MPGRLFGRTTCLWAAMTIMIVAVTACGSDGPDTTTPGQVSQLLGTWQFAASFRVGLANSPPDSLDCSITGAALTLAGPIDPWNVSGSWPFTLHGTLSNGSLSCQGTAEQTFTQAITPAQVNLLRAIFAANIDFTLATPSGDIRVYGSAEEGTGSDSVTTSVIRGYVGATTDTALLHSADTWRILRAPFGTFLAERR